MKKLLCFLMLSAIFFIPGQAQDIKDVKPVKNIILLIPDGTSPGSVSLARWIQWYQSKGKIEKLFIDPYLCGTIRTSCSDSPIGDSAPTTSCYMTGHMSKAGWVATYPIANPKNDLYPIDTTLSYQPMMTLLEAAKAVQGRSTGLVVTCEFPHATPADCASHSYNRGRYDWIAPQMVHNNLNVMIGGGAQRLSAADKKYLEEKGYGVFINDMNGMRNYKGDNMWSLLTQSDMSYELDRDPAKEPSLDETTKIAIDKLSKNPKGFFLMVEGSKVDWVAHSNDAPGIASEFLAFDRACKVAFDFARSNGETAVIIVPDHCTGGTTIGRQGFHINTADGLFGPVARVKMTAEAIADKLNSIPNSEVQQLFRENVGYELSKEEMNALNNCKDYKNSPIPADKRSATNVEASLYSGSMTTFVTKIEGQHSGIGFTSNSHTGDDVFLAAYHPSGVLPVGMHTNIELNHYMCNLFGFQVGDLDKLTQEYFAPSTKVFKDYKCTIIASKDSTALPTLVVTNKKKQLNITPNSNIVTLGKKGKEKIELNTVVVYVDRNKTFYLPKKLADYLK